MTARASRYWRSRDGLLVLPALIFYAAVYLLPMGRLVAWSAWDHGPTMRNYATFFTDATYRIALGNTLKVSFLVTGTTLLLGYPLAYTLALVGARSRAALMLLILIPFWTSVLVRTFAWLMILGNNGVVNRALMGLGVITAPQQMLFNLFGVEVGMVHVLLPFMVFPLYAVMARIDERQVQVARSLGARPARAFLHVFLPMSLPGVAAGCVLVFLLAIGFYITPALLGGPREITLATMIDMLTTTLLDWGLAAALGVVLLVVVGVIFMIFSRLLGVHRMIGVQASR